MTQDKWTLAVEKALGYEGKSVIYCVTFTHGLMKIGATKDLHKRLVGLTSHGLFRHMVDEVIATPCPKHHVYAAEQALLTVLKGLAVVRGPEIFETCDLSRIPLLMAEAVSSSAKPNLPRLTTADYVELAMKTNLSGAFHCLARERAMSWAVDEVMVYMEKGVADELEWNRIYMRIPPLSYGVITPIIERNAVLIGRGVDYDTRKKLLEQYAIDLRGEAQPLTTGGQQ